MGALRYWGGELGNLQNYEFQAPHKPLACLGLAHHFPT